MPMKLEVKRMETTCDVVVKALGGNGRWRVGRDKGLKF